MKRITYLAAIVVGVLAWAAPAHAASESFTGNVKAVSGSSITVERGTLSGVFMVNANTHLSVRGATAKTREARAAGGSGHRGSWLYAAQGDAWVAADIHVLVSLAAK